MKKIVAVEKIFCDVCGKESHENGNCLNCGKNVCYKCELAFAHRYQSNVFRRGCGDGLYCNECDAKLRLYTDNPLYIAYREIEALQKERADWEDDFDKRRKIVEQKLEMLELTNKI